MTRPLPDGWAWATIGDLLLGVEAGRSPRCLTRRVQGDEYGVIKVSAMTYGEFRPDEHKALAAGTTVAPHHEIRPGDLLFSRANTTEHVGAVVLVQPGVQPRLLLSDKSVRLLPHPDICPAWLMYAMRAPEVRAQLRAAASGTKDNMRNISQEKLLSVRVAVAPVAEQLRIVQDLDALRAGLDSAQRQAAGLLRLLDALQSRFLTDFAAGHVMRPLKDVLREPLRNGYSAREVPGGSGVPVFSISAVTRRDFGPAHQKPTDVTRERANGLFCEAGDIFIQRSNTPDLVGSAAMYRGPEGSAIFPDLLIRIRVKDEMAPEYLELFLQSPPARAYFRGRAQGLAGSMPKINQPTILALPVPDLPRAAQEAHSTALAGRLEQVARGRSAVADLNVRLEALWTVALREAFAGSSSVPDATGETAQSLLERIAADRITAKPGAPRRRSGTVSVFKPRTGTARIKDTA